MYILQVHNNKKGEREIGESWSYLGISTFVPISVVKKAEEAIKRLENTNNRGDKTKRGNKPCSQCGKPWFIMSPHLFDWIKFSNIILPLHLSNLSPSRLCSPLPISLWGSISANMRTRLCPGAAQSIPLYMNNVSPPHLAVCSYIHKLLRLNRGEECIGKLG